MSCWTQLATGRHRGRHIAQPTVLSHAWFCGKTAVGTRYGAPKLGGCAPKTRFVARRCAREYYSVEGGAQNVPERGHPWEKTRSTRALQGCSRASLIDHCHRHRQHCTAALRIALLPPQPLASAALPAEQHSRSAKPGPRLDSLHPEAHRSPHRSLGIPKNFLRIFWIFRVYGPIWALMGPYGPIYPKNPKNS